MTVSFDGDYPSLTLLVAFGGSDVDISAYIRSIDTDRPTSDETGRYSPGRMTIVLDNRDGRFTPANLSGPYVSAGVTQVVAEIDVRLYATYSAADYNIFCGIVEDWNDEFPSQGYDAVTVLTVVDHLASVSAWNGDPVAAVGDNEKSGDRVGRILDAAGFSASRRLIDTGDESLQATTLEGNGLDQLHHVVDSEGGAVWFEPQGGTTGRLIFSSRSARATDTRRTVAQATFSNAVIPFRDVRVSSARQRIVRSASFTRTGGAAQTAGSGLPRVTKTGLSNVDDTSTQALAEMAVAQGDPADNYRVRSLMVDPVISGNWGALLALRMQDRCTVTVVPPVSGTTIARNCFVDGIAHSIRPQQWTISYEFQSAAAWDGFSVDVWDTGTWDSSTWFF